MTIVMRAITGTYYHYHSSAILLFITEWHWKTSGKVGTTLCRHYKQGTSCGSSAAEIGRQWCMFTNVAKETNVIQPLIGLNTSPANQWALNVTDDWSTRNCTTPLQQSESAAYLESSSTNCRELIMLSRCSDVFVLWQGERSFLGDELIEGGQLGKMCNGKEYTEVRNYQRPNLMIRFYFTTRCYSPYMETVIGDLSQPPYVDIIIMNSCLWDITRFTLSP